MKTRKPLALIIGGAVCLALALLAAFFLVRSIAGYGKVRGQLATTRAELDRLIAGDPAHGNRFPSESNVAITESNLAALKNAFSETFGAFSGIPGDAAVVEPARFPLLLDQTLRGLNEKAAVHNVTVPERFAYGFDQYSAALPNKDDIPRLARQLLCVDAACRALFDQRIVQLVRVQRQLFDAQDKATAPVSGPTAGRAPVAGPGTALPPGEFLDPTGLYFRERILLTFQSHEQNVWNSLNALAKLVPFCVLTDISIENRTGSPGVQAAAGAGPAGTDGLSPAGADPLAAATADPAAAAREKRILTHKERIVAGQSDVIEVTVGLDFIRFKSLGSDEQNRSSP